MLTTADTKVQLVSNFFKFKLGSKQSSFWKYAIHIKPEIPDDAKLRLDIYNAAKKQIFEKIGPNVFSQTAIYAVDSIPDIDVIKINYKGTDYKMLIEWAGPIEFHSHEGSILLRRFLGNLIRRRRLINIKKNYYDPSQKIIMQSSGFEIWPGYSTTVNLFGKNLLIGINLTYKVLRSETAYDKLLKLRNELSSKTNFEQIIDDEFKGLIVLTRYNGDKSYYIDGVDFVKNTNFEFEIKSKQGDKYTTTIKEYYFNKYKIEIKDPRQPLLINKSIKTGEIIYLIPELCFLTGLTEENRANTNLMKELANITKGNANSKIKDIKNFMQGITSLKEYKSESEKWGVLLDENPITFDSTKINAGRILMSKQGNSDQRHSFDIETANFDREIQQEMYSQPALSNWIIFVSSKDMQHCETALSTFRQVSETFKYPLSKPEVIQIKGNSPKDWISTIESNVNPNIQLVLCICPGQKGKAPMYSDIKNLLMTKYPIPSQVILANTIAKGKGLRSIINKLLMQICAKVGGEPWAIDNVPFTKVPTMVCGVDIYSKTIKGEKKVILALAASFNRTFTRFISIAKVLNEGEDMSGALKEATVEATTTFAKSNGIAPIHIFMIRDGISSGQIATVVNVDIKKIKDGLKEAGFSSKLTKLIVNRKSKNKFFSVGKGNGADFQNPGSGTLISDTVTDPLNKEFYLISQKTLQGTASPIHYQCLCDDSESDPYSIYLFVYKLCYLYYNWSGSIKVPAPVHYAKKLAFMVGDHLSTGGVAIPNERLTTQIKSLFYI